MSFVKHLFGVEKLKMEDKSNGNAKISDSGYSNTCSNSQSQGSSDSSTSRNSNLSTSSGYEGENFSILKPRKEISPQSIGKRKSKDEKKNKKLKVVVAAENIATDVGLKSSDSTTDNPCYDIFGPDAKVINEKKSEEVGTIELVEATDDGDYNDERIDDAEAGLASPTYPLDDSISQQNGEPELAGMHRNAPFKFVTSEKGFCVVISMRDGLVLYTTPSISTALGFPENSWIGRSFIDYVHPRDKKIFTQQINNALVLPEENRSKAPNRCRRSSLFCDLRKNTNCRSPILQDERERNSSFYLPFHLTLTFRDFTEHPMDHPKRSMFLVISTQPVHSAYKAPEERIISSTFSTRHTATCNLSYVDPDVVYYFGYLPQDMLGRSLFDFYHPEDLPLIKDIYETVIKYEGSSFRSKPYRFAAKNGSYVVLDTHWSSFINPWTKKLEFVVGQHRILKGPRDHDVFGAADGKLSCKNLGTVSEEVVKESKIVEGEIRALLNEPIKRPYDRAENDVLLSRCKELSFIMDNLMQEVRGSCRPLKDPLIADDKSFSERDSVMMLGEISPHRDYYNNKSSTETLPSYNQLNYNENMERFFKSKPPVATMYDSSEEIPNDQGAEKCMSPINESGASGSGSGENFSNNSNKRTNPAIQGYCFHLNNNEEMTTGFTLPTLTSQLLSQHNEDMEKLMMQKHRELRSSIKNNDKIKDNRVKSSVQKMTIDQNVHYVGQGHGIKRCAGHMLEADNFKISKHDETSTTTKTGYHIPTNICTRVTSMVTDQTSTILRTNANVNLWQPISLAVSPSTSSPSEQPCASLTINTAVVPRLPILSPVIPIYYVPIAQGQNLTETARCKLQESCYSASSSQPATQNNSYAFVPVSYVTAAATAATAAGGGGGGDGNGGLLYSPMLTNPSHGTMTYRMPFLIPNQTSTVKEKVANIKLTPDDVMANFESSHRGMPSSRLSNDGEASSLVDVSTECNAYRHKQTEFNCDESSSSSFYNSFFNRSSDCSCNHQPEQKTRKNSIQQEQGKQEQLGKRRKVPPWLEGVELTPELIYEYQVNPKTLNEVLQADMKTLKKLDQPLLVNDQLGQLYLDMELEGFDTKLLLEEGITSSSSDSDSGSSGSEALQHKQIGKTIKYAKLLMIHEENAPFPPPLQPPQPPQPPQPLTPPSKVPTSSSTVCSSTVNAHRSSN